MTIESTDTAELIGRFSAVSRGAEGYGQSVMDIYATLPKFQFYVDLKSVVTLIETQDAELVSLRQQVADLEMIRLASWDANQKLAAKVEGNVATHAALERTADLESLLSTQARDINRAAGVSARFERLLGICRRILWINVGVPAIENEATKAALDDLSQFLFADGVDAAIRSPK